jgi:hypothetical protein
VIFTLLVTLLVEGAVCLGYSIWRKKPVRPVLLTSLLANLVTQSLLWVALNLFFQHYVVTLFIAEILIWLMESVFLFGLRMNRLSMREALLLSLMMNASSFGLGLFLPV